MAPKIAGFPGALTRTTATAVSNVMQRFASVFQTNTSAISPGDPIIPVNPEPDGPKKFQITQGQNLITHPRGEAGGELLAFDQLRFFARNYDIAAIAIRRRIKQMQGLQWDIVARDKDSKGDEATIKRVRAFWQQPTPQLDWTRWLAMLLRDALEIDAMTLYPRKTRGGGLYSLQPIDGATIKLLVDVKGKTPDAPAPAYQQVLQGRPTATFSADELIYWPRNVSTDKVYGTSEIEDVLMKINTALRKQQQDLAHWTEGNVPYGLIGVPDTWTAEQIRGYQQFFDDWMAGNAEARSRLIMAPTASGAGLPVHEFAAFSGDPVFDKWLMQVVLAALDMTPAELGFTDDVNRASSDGQENVTYRNGINPLALGVSGLVNYVTATYLDAPDLEHKFTSLEADDELKKAQVNQIYITTGIKDSDEIRTDLGLDPRGPDKAFILAPAPMLVKNIGQMPGYGADGQPLPGHVDQSKGAAEPLPPGGPEDGGGDGAKQWPYDTAGGAPGGKQDGDAHPAGAKAAIHLHLGDATVQKAAGADEGKGHWVTLKGHAVYIDHEGKFHFGGESSEGVDPHDADFARAFGRHNAENGHIVGADDATETNVTRFHLSDSQGNQAKHYVKIRDRGAADASGNRKYQIKHLELPSKDTISDRTEIARPSAKAALANRVLSEYQARQMRKHAPAAAPVHADARTSAQEGDASSAAGKAAPDDDAHPAGSSAALESSVGADGYRRFEGKVNPFHSQADSMFATDNRIKTHDFTTPASAAVHAWAVSKWAPQIAALDPVEAQALNDYQGQYKMDGSYGSTKGDLPDHPAYPRDGSLQRPKPVQYHDDGSRPTKSTFTEHDLKPLYERVNAVARGKTWNLTPSVQHDAERRVAAMDAGIANQTVPENIVVHRAIGHPTLDPKTFIPGAEFVDKGFASTSLLPDFVERFAQSGVRGPHKVIAEVRVPKGAHAAYLDALHPTRTSAWEMLLPRNTRYRVVSFTPGTNNGYGETTHRAVLEVVP